MSSPQLLQSVAHTGNLLYYGYEIMEQPQQWWSSCSPYGPYIQGYSTSPSAAQLVLQDSSRKAQVQTLQRPNEYLEVGAVTPIETGSIGKSGVSSPKSI